MKAEAVELAIKIVAPPAHPPQAAPDIRERFAAARAAGKRAKDAAESLGLSEGAAVAAHAGEHGHPLKAVPLQGSWLELLQALEACGPLMALTRTRRAPLVRVT